MAFTRRNRSGYATLGKMDFQHPVLAVKKCFQIVPYLENIIDKEVAFDAARFCILPVLSKEKAFADIHRNVGRVHSGTIRQRRRWNCKKPVITWPLERLANLSPSDAS